MISWNSWKWQNKTQNSYSTSLAITNETERRMKKKTQKKSLPPSFFIVWYFMCVLCLIHVSFWYFMVEIVELPNETVSRMLQVNLSTTLKVVKCHMTWSKVIKIKISHFISRWQTERMYVITRHTNVYNVYYTFMCWVYFPIPRISDSIVARKYKNNKIKKNYCAAEL